MPKLVSSHLSRELQSSIQYRLFCALPLYFHTQKRQDSVRPIFCSRQVTLTDFIDKHISKTTKYTASDYKTCDEKSESNSPILDLLYSEWRNDAEQFVTNFGRVKSTEIWMAVTACVSANESTEKDREKIV